LKGRNEDKVKMSADHVKKLLEARVGKWPGLVLAGPAPAPLLKAESFYRHQIMVRCRAMSRLSGELAEMERELALPDDIQMGIDIDPVNLS